MFGEFRIQRRFKVFASRKGRARLVAALWCAALSGNAVGGGRWWEALAFALICLLLLVGL